MKTQSTRRPALFWFRRDLRLDDNTGLWHALESGRPVVAVFIFDRNILDALEDEGDRRVIFIYREITRLKSELENNYNSTLISGYGDPIEQLKTFTDEFQPVAVYANEDYEPYAIERDRRVSELLERHNIEFHTYKDHVIHAKSEVVKTDGKPYTVFTPYSRQWHAQLNAESLRCYPISDRGCFQRMAARPLSSLSALGFEDDEDLVFPDRNVSDARLKSYATLRNIPFANGGSSLGVHLRFGTISIRKLALRAKKWSDVYLNELAWRDFFQQILWHFPHVVEKCFKPRYETLDWRNNEREFQRWCDGLTGYPMVDAGMRELNATGMMHNRVRMVTAGFLTRHLLVDWRWGEAYFAQKLLDYDLASNNGNWQWAAGTGCDAVPYFRIFNPIEQARKFDPDGLYIRKWVTEVDTTSYPDPIVDHKIARARALKAYRETGEGLK